MDGIKLFTATLYTPFVTLQVVKFVNPANPNAYFIPAVPPDTISTTVSGVVSSTSGDALFLGNSDATTVVFQPFDAYIAKFNRWTSPTDPQTVWNSYMDGNGQSSSSALSGYGINMTLLQNNIAKGTYTLL